MYGGSLLCPLYPLLYEVNVAQKSSGGSGPCVLEGGLRPENPSNRRFFRPEANFYHRYTAVNVSKRNISTHVAGNEHFLEPLGPKYLLSPDAVKNSTWTRGVGYEVKFPSADGGSVNKEIPATNVSCCYSDFIDFEVFCLLLS